MSEKPQLHVLFAKNNVQILSNILPTVNKYQEIRFMIDIIPSRLSYSLKADIIYAKIVENYSISVNGIIIENLRLVKR